mgnify:CR=1 FL=1
MHLYNNTLNLFQFTLLVRGATCPHCGYVLAKKISIHAPRERSDRDNVAGCFDFAISIHAPRERSDGYKPGWAFYQAKNFNPRSS